MQLPIETTKLHLSIRPLTPITGEVVEGPTSTGDEWSLTGTTTRIWHRPFWLWPPDHAAVSEHKGDRPTSCIHYQPDATLRQNGGPSSLNGGHGLPSPTKPHQISLLISGSEHPRLAFLEGIGHPPALDDELGVPLPFEFYIYDGVLNLGGHHMQLAPRMIVCVRPNGLDNPSPDGEFSLRVTLFHPDAGPVFDHLGVFQQVESLHEPGG